jgi:hypothetical protein
VCVVIHHYDLICIFLTAKRLRPSFPELILPSLYPLQFIMFMYFAYFLVGFFSWLNMSDTILSNIWFENIWSHTKLITLPSEQDLLQSKKLLILIVSNLLIFSFMNLLFKSKSSSPRPISQTFSPESLHLLLRLGSILT